jgi:hypothetical protein
VKARKSTILDFSQDAGGLRLHQEDDSFGKLGLQLSAEPIETRRVREAPRGFCVELRTREQLVL